MRLPKINRTAITESVRNGMEKLGERKRDYSRDLPTTPKARIRPAVDQLSSYGFEKYNVDNYVDIYVSREDKKDVFKDDAPVFTPVKDEELVPKIETFAPKNQVTGTQTPSFMDKVVTIQVPVQAQMDRFVSTPEPEPVKEVKAEPAEEPEPEPEPEPIEVFHPNNIDVDEPLVKAQEPEPEPEPEPIQIEASSDEEDAIEPLSLFGNVPRGRTIEVDTHIGFVDDGVLKEVGAVAPVEIAPIPEPQEMRVAEVEVEHFEILDQQIQNIMESLKPIEKVTTSVETEEVMMIRPYIPPVAEAQPEEEVMMIRPCVAPIVEWEIDVPYVERDVPKIEDFFNEAAVVAWDVDEEVAGAFADFIASIPEEEYWPRVIVIPEWDVTEAAAEAFPAYISMIPEEEYWVREVIIPEWDVTEEAAEAYPDYLAMIPEEEYWVKQLIIPEWDITEETAEVYGAYLTIWPQYPKAAVIIPEWDVAEAASEAYPDYLAMIPEEEYWVREVVIPEWDITEETAEVFGAYLTIWPQYPKAPVIIPEWDVTEEAVASFDAYQNIRPEYPRAAVVIPEWDASDAVCETFADFVASIPEEEYWVREVVIPEWDVTEETAEVFGAYLTIWPQYPKAQVVIPAWDVTADAADSYNAYQSIRPEYPRAAVIIPEWDVAEAASEAYPDYLAMIPEEEYWTIQIPAWDITEEGAEAFGQYLSIRPEYPRAAVIIPEWDVGEAAVEAYPDYLATIPEEEYWVREVIIPEWDITDEAAASLEGYRMVEADYFMQAKAVVTSTLSVSKIVIDEIETNIEDKDAVKMGRTGNMAKTGSSSTMKLRVKDNTDIDQSNLVINSKKLPARRATASRFIFKDGRLQKVSVKVEVPEVDPAAQNEVSLITEIPEAVTVTEESLEVEPVAPAPEYIALPAAQNYAALPLPKSAKLAAKNIEGVRFSFGKTGSGSGSIRFSF